MANEKRLIEANELEEKFRITKIIEVFPEWENLSFQTKHKLVQFGKTVKMFVQNAPTVDAVEVVHGRWQWDVESHGDPMYGIDEDYGYRCSECKVWADEYGVDGDIYEEPPTNILHYCPNCGADMRERKDNE